jgi:hypothetical protein
VNVHSSANFAAEHLAAKVTWIVTWEFTRVSGRIDVMLAAKHLPVPITFQNTCQLTWCKKNTLTTKTQNEWKKPICKYYINNRLSSPARTAKRLQAHLKKEKEKTHSSTRQFVLTSLCPDDNFSSRAFFFFFEFSNPENRISLTHRKKKFFCFWFQKIVVLLPGDKKISKNHRNLHWPCPPSILFFWMEKIQRNSKENKQKNLQLSCCAWFSPPKCFFLAFFVPLKRPTCLTDSLLFKRNLCKRIESISEWLPLKRNLLKKRKKTTQHFWNKICLSFFFSFNFGQAPRLVWSTQRTVMQNPFFFWKKQKLFAFRKWQKY